MGAEEDFASLMMSLIAEELSCTSDGLVIKDNQGILCWQNKTVYKYGVMIGFSLLVINDKNNNEVYIEVVDLCDPAYDPMTDVNRIVTAINALR